MTLWKQEDAPLVSLHWQGKLRGLEFQPVPFRFEVTGSPDVLDAKGRQVQLPTLRPSSEEAAEDKQQSEADADRALLQAMIADPNGTQQAWANAIGRAKGRVNAKLQRLKKEALVAVTLGKWSVTQRAGRRSNRRKRAEQADD